jgi:hypothetical protein
MSTAPVPGLSPPQQRKTEPRKHTQKHTSNSKQEPDTTGNKFDQLTELKAQNTNCHPKPCMVQHCQCRALQVVVTTYMQPLHCGGEQPLLA